MPEDYIDRIRSLSPAKALAVAAYGESVASYRYRTLAERITNPTHKKALIDMAEEEHEHHETIQAVINKHYPNSDFVLSAQDKSLIIAGPRMLEVGGKSLDTVLDKIEASEEMTGRFYEALSQTMANEKLIPLLNEMAAECFDHAKRIRTIFGEK